MTPKVLYRAHGYFVSKLFEHDPSRLRDRAPLAVVRWLLDRFEVWEMRHNFRRMHDVILRNKVIAQRLEALRVVMTASGSRAQSEDKP